MTTGNGKDDFVPYSPLPSNPNPNYNYHSYPSYPPPQNVVVLLPRYRPDSTFRRRRCLCYSALFFLLILLAAAVFFLYPSDPDIHLVRIRLDRIGIRADPIPVLDVSFSVTVKVRNKDFFSVDYDRLFISIGYRGRQLGLVDATGGKIKARASSYVDATVVVNGFEVIYDAFYLLEDLAKGVIPFDTQTRVEGKLGLFFFDVPLKATVSCEVYVNVKNQTIARQDCYPESLGDKLDQSTNVGAEDA
ncbi:hypothetical protein PIB30_056555 [Stylosanthes scabra]|uniref:Late embryogenesis abundant protein LEA-2 subgroup domain-containing protein n=1 Tax=Stylosanthes scabra TaxID=79078 RepID=A0ABU6WL40_9FABA|nr:hypothetical protein [Stylosanthes scabra]